MQFLEGIEFHESAFIAATVFGGSRDEGFVGAFLLEAVEHPGFRGDDDSGCGRLSAPLDHFLGGTDDIGEHADGAGAFRVGDQWGIGMLVPDAADGGVGPFDVDVAIAFPEGHGAAGLFHHPAAEVFVGDKEQIAVGGGGVDDADGVAAGADDIAEGLHGGGAIDIGDGVEIGVGLLEGGEAIGGAAFFEGTAGIEVGEEDAFVGVEDFGGFGHEMDATEDDDVGGSTGGLLGEAEGIADEIGDILDFWDLVIMGEDDGVEALFQAEDFACEGIQALGGEHGSGGEPVGTRGHGIGHVNHGQSVDPEGAVDKVQGASFLGLRNFPRGGAAW